VKTESLPGLYSISVANDGETVWKKYYEIALEATQDYVKFVDHGDADWERVIVLESPDGSKRTKRFSRIGVVK
jgi:hypothetical protein